MKSNHSKPRGMGKIIIAVAMLAAGLAGCETAEQRFAEAGNVPVDPTAMTLVGKWAAARSKTEAFALQINTDGTFALVTVSGGKTSQSTGKYTLVGNKLTLTDTKGTKIAGTATLRSAKEFKFLPTGAKSPLTFKKPA